MRIRRVLIYSIATTAMLLVSPAPSLILDMPASALAATRVSVSINTFYSDLAPYGSWVSYHDSYVYVPGRIAVDWRPYTLGHWVYTRRYGWLWVSDEPFGWATYHYGRWGYSEEIGWYWVPGRRWAPAWVSWRRSYDHVVWAPLPPVNFIDVSIEIRDNDIPDYYWVAVPSRDFLDADLTTVVVRDDTERVRVVEAAKPVGSVTVKNNVVVNNAIDVDYVQKTTDKKVEAVNVKETDDPKQAGKPQNGEVAVFNGDVKEEKGAKPAEVADVEVVKKKKAASGGTQPSTTQGQGTTTTEGQERPIKKKKATTTEQPTQPEQGQAEQGQQQPTEKKKATSEQPTQPEQGQAEQGQEQPTKKKKKAATTEQSTQPEQGQAEQTQEQPTKKKKKAATTEQSTQPEQGQAEQGQEQPTKKKKKAATTEQSTQPEQGQAEQGQEQPTKKKKKAITSEESTQPEQGQGQPPKMKKPSQGEQQQKGCDPATGENC